MVTGVTSNLEMKRVFQATQAKVTAGDTLSLGSLLFPSCLNNWSASERSAGIWRVTLPASPIFMIGSWTLIDAALGMLEPILTVGIGIIIGVVALTIIVPIYSLIGSAGG